MTEEIKEEQISQVDKNYNTYIGYIKSFIKRDNVDKFISWLERTDIKVAPASTKYHLSCEGGLITHSLNVFNRLIKLMANEFPKKQVVDENGNLVVDENNNPVMENTCPYSKETITLVALLHDISKVNYYEKYYRNVQNQETGNWEKVESYKTRDNKFIYGTHSENSLYMIRKFFDLSYEEELAILHHMGGLDYSEKDVQRDVLSAFRVSKLAALLHIADMSAMVLDE